MAIWKRPAKILEMKEKSKLIPIEVFPDPEIAVVHLSQHVGVPNNPVVSEGDKVLAGQKIGDCEHWFSAPVHSPISGRVVKIDNAHHPCVGESSPAISIENDGKNQKDKAMKPMTEEELQDIPNKEIVKRVKEAGIVGLGGAVFPTHIKLSPPSDMPIKYLVVNGCESEPYNTSDERLMIENASDIVKGVRVMRRVLGNPSVVIAIKDKKKEALKSMSEAFSGEPGTRIEAKPFAYFQGDAGMLQKALFGYEIPAGKRSYEYGVVVNNVGTIRAVAKAVFDGEPLISRAITLTGDIENPKNLMVKIGTTASQILRHYDINVDEVQKVVFGGVMMGYSAPNMDVPIVKATSALAVFSRKESMARKRRTKCIRCSQCIEACPATGNV